MKRLFKYCITALLWTSISAFAYEPKITHSRLSGEAYSRSVLVTDPDVLRDLGLSESVLLSSLSLSSGSIVQHLRSGAVEEDHGKRALNHFFDPTRNAPITVFGIRPGKTSPDWALAARGSIPEQASSYYDAREYFYQALTAPDKKAREFLWASTFATLGNVVHHLQDMAQPQHVRNDVHLDQYKLGGVNPFYNPSLYEKYSTGANVPGLSSSATPVYSPSNLSHFNSPRQFWVNGGKGLAEYTNRGFVSAGTNLTGTFSNIQPNSRFPAPSGAGAVIETRQISDPALAAECPGSPIPKGLIGQINFIGTPVEDKVTGITEVNKRTSTYSIFDEDLQNYAGLNAVFSLNRFNYCEAHKFLIPRAVAYSAGLINYFFRGKIDFVPDPQNSNAYVIKNMGPEAMNGTFALYYDADDGLRYPVPGASWNLQIRQNGQVDSLTFAPPANPAPLQPDEYILVFKGDMGQEVTGSNSVGAVAAKVINNPEPDLYIIDPRYHYIERFSADGEFRKKFFTGIGGNAQETGLTVYKENYYYNWNSMAPGPPYVGGATKNGIDFASFETPNGVANNGQMVFVTHVNDSAATVSIFDMEGNPLESRPVSPAYSMEGGSVYVAANRTHFATTSNGYLYGYSIAGGQVFEVSGLHISSQYVAMTIDRIFAVSDNQILSYTLNGDALGSILTIPPGIVGCVDATENRFYVTTQFGGQRKLHIYIRSVKRDSNRQILQENYAFLKSVPLQYGFSEPQCSVDRSYMDALYKAP